MSNVEIIMGVGATVGGGKHPNVSKTLSVCHFWSKPREKQCVFNTYLNNKQINPLNFQIYGSRDPIFKCRGRGLISWWMGGGGGGGGT